MRAAILTLLLTACAAPVPKDAGKRFTVEHNFFNIDDGMRLAERHCAQFSMVAWNLAHEGKRSSYVCEEPK